MTVTRALPLLVASVLALGARPARAQDLPPLVIEPRGGAALPVASFRTGPDHGGEIARAPSFGLHFVYRSSAGWGPYGGFSQHRFDCGGDGCPGGEYVATSWDFGAQRTLGSFGWLRAGVLFARLERDVVVGAGSTPGGRGAARAASSLSMGAEAGAGLRVPLRGRMSLTPGVRYGWLNTRFRDGGPVGMRWLAADVGLAIGF
jgi:hypothetical protein